MRYWSEITLQLRWKKSERVTETERDSFPNSKSFLDMEKNCAKKMAQNKIEQEGFLMQELWISFHGCKEVGTPSCWPLWDQRYGMSQL